MYFIRNSFFVIRKIVKLFGKNIKGRLLKTEKYFCGNKSVATLRFT